jgi:ABC-type multidrug transport system ATPase subunit
VSFFNVYETVKSVFAIGKKGREFDILKDFKGVAKPGEMVLVLGRPGSGCTTFLKVISNQRYGYTKVDGNVQYGPFDSDLFEKRYRGEAVYCEEEENHHVRGLIITSMSIVADAVLADPHSRSNARFCTGDESPWKTPSWLVAQRFQREGYRSDVEDV